MMYNVRLDGGRLITSVYYDANSAPQEGDILNLAPPPVVGDLFDNRDTVQPPKQRYKITKVTMGVAAGVDPGDPEPTLVVELVG